MGKRENGENTRRTKKTKKKANPLAAWAGNHRKRQAETQTVKKTKKVTTQNEALIYWELTNIDFEHSSLPKEDLEYKSNPNQPCGDLEYAAQQFQQLLLADEKTAQTDLHLIDEQLLILAGLFRQAVERGERKTAYAAKGALARGLVEIRARIPQNQPELAWKFVEQSADYLKN